MKETKDADLPEREPGDADPEATPVCPHCLEPFEMGEYYCRRCGESVGQLTGILPFVNIRFQMLFIGRLWRKAWDDDSSWQLPARLGALLLSFALVPLLLPIALGMGIWGAASRLWRRPPPAGQPGPG